MLILIQRINNDLPTRAETQILPCKNILKFMCYNRDLK